MVMKPGDLITVRKPTVPWIVGQPLPDTFVVYPGELLLFIGPAAFKYIKILHPIRGVRRISRHLATPVQPEPGHGTMGPQGG
jgi:hypothetical protein